MEKIVGLDLGTNSIGLAVRNLDRGNELKDQLEYFTSVIFQSGVGNGKSGEFSYAAERTKHRSKRRLYQSRKYRIWSTLRLLIENGYCPLSIEDLEKWSKYDKKRGLKRQYPADAVAFEQWVRLDFDGDGRAEYSSPYQLRAELMERQFDFSKELERYKLGRALYHIAQRRGFKSSKGETLKEQEKVEKALVNQSAEVEDMAAELKKSEEKKSKDLVAYMQTHKLQTVGCALYALEKEGVRVRASQYQAVRSQYRDEIKAIFAFQIGLETDSDFYKSIISEKKGNGGTIFYKRPLRSQKGQVGKCTLEPSKPRCPISHPDFEEFRAWAFINTIKFRTSINSEWRTLDLEQKQKLYNEKFLRTASYFRFVEIVQWLSREIGCRVSYKDKTVNYKEQTSVSGCPISGRLRNLLGDEWQTWSLETERTNPKTGEVYSTTYNYSALWHICFSFDDVENVDEFAQNVLLFDRDSAKQLVRIWGAVQQGYASLSLKAIQNINRFLRKGLIYSDAVLLAKLPDIFKDQWNDQVEAEITREIDCLTRENRQIKMYYSMANTLIANYKSLSYNDETGIDERFAEHNTEYQLDDLDREEVKHVVIAAIGKQSWDGKSTLEQQEMLDKVSNLYQQFFASEKRDYYKLPKLATSLSDLLGKRYKSLKTKDLKKIYHPSIHDVYAPAKYSQLENGRCLKLLGSPVIGAIKNPMAMRVLHILRKQINGLIINGIIDEDTRIVVETARELNDANMRWAIAAYQSEREEENKGFEEVIKALLRKDSVSCTDVEKARLLSEQSGEYEEELKLKKIIRNQFANNEVRKKAKDKLINKYRLWLEQGCRCVYTGKMINITSLFDENSVDFEHTIPRSISFDDSMSNLTVCDAYFNRHTKKNQLPSQLDNYSEILTHIQPWIDKLDSLKDNVEFWKAKSKQAHDKASKDQCIRMRHLWQMELDYWQKKVNAFTITEVRSSFRNSQLVDTRIITRYAFHYLKTVFNRVDVQKAIVTDSFRKIIGVQSIDEKKSREKHSHHAIDAIMLTLIPVAAKRDRMIELFYQYEEAQKLFNTSECSRLQGILQKEIRQCVPRDSSQIKDFIEENILVNHISKDQTLTPAKRKARRRGKEIFIMDRDGNLVNKWITGSCIRGQLHKESFFGAILYPKVDNGGMPKKKDGKFDYEGVSETMVMREPIESFKKEKDLEKIIDPIVKKSILSAMQKAKEEKKSFAQAIIEGIYLLDKDGNERKFDKNGRAILPIRHVRCKVAAGRGYFTKDKAIVVKKQTYKSSKPLVNIENRDYKYLYYAQNDGNYLCLLYEGVNKGKLERKFRLINYFDTALHNMKDTSDLFKEPNFTKIEDKKKAFTLRAIIKTGTRVLMWDKTPDELAGMSDKELSRRLFVVYKFNNTGSDVIYLQNHIEARDEKEIMSEDHKLYDISNYQARLHLVAGNFNCLIEDVDFEVSTNGKIKLL